MFQRNMSDEKQKLFESCNACIVIQNFPNASKKNSSTAYCLMNMK